MSDVEAKTIIGRAERADFPDADVVGLPVKVDTGAYRSSIWATNIHVKDGVLYFTLLGESSEYYTGKEISTTEFTKVEVENSFGHSQTRYSVFLRIRIQGRLIKSNFTLANRSTKTYPALLGRKLLKNRFMVDVATGQPLEDEEVNGDESLE